MVTLGPWIKGMNNRTADHALPGDACRNAVNVDFDNSGKAKRRPGATKIYNGLGTSSGFSCPLGEFFVENRNLNLLLANNTATALYRGVGAGTFWYENSTVYFSDNVVALKITADGAARWGVAAPTSFSLAAVSGGDYGAGVYMACCCFVDADGVESGNSPIKTMTIPSGYGISFSNLPTAPTGGAVRLYLSTANGTEMYHVADTTLPVFTLMSGRYDNGNVFEHLSVSPPPPGRIICFYNGRAYVAVGNVVYYSDPFSPDHFRLSENYILFPEAVDVMMPVTSGILFCYGNRTDLYLGQPDEGFQVIEKFNYGGVYGTAKKIPKSSDVCWQSQRGMVIASADGQCRNMQEDNVATESAVAGATLIREKNGVRQFIASLQQPTTSPLAATSWIDAEIIRRG